MWKWISKISDVLQTHDKRDYVGIERERERERLCLKRDNFLYVLGCFSM